MGGCSADYCTNSTAKGFQMLRFPREAKRRKVWFNNVNREGWVPGPSSTLCNIHFTEDMFEKTRDGKRRLKSDAVPTIFRHSTITPCMLEETENKSTQIIVNTTLATEEKGLMPLNVVLNNNKYLNMPTCAFGDCTNSSKKKFKMNSFPRNPSQRAIWIRNMGRKDYVPHDSAALCEAHFAPHMWEKTRVDGSRKLKYNAVPTIFGDRIVEEIPVLKINIENSNRDSNAIPSSSNSMKNPVISNSQSLINLVPSTNSTIPHPTAILIPAASILEAQSTNSASAIVVDSQGKFINSVNSNISSINHGSTSILKPQTKITKSQTSPMIISTSASILKNQIKAANNHTPIIIPAPNSILKSQMQTTNSQLHLNNEAVSSQSILIPVASSLVPEAQSTNPQLSPTSQFEPFEDSCINNNTVHSDSDDRSDSLNRMTRQCHAKSMCDTASNQQTTSTTLTLNTTGIFLNKAQAKKREDERFEKMDKLLLKQLKLNSALRKKLSSMSHKMQQLMKEQNSDHKDFLKDVFTEDQIRVLELRHTNPKSITAWSHKTMMKAIKLKQECGTRGYEELLNQSMPLPSIRTICRWCTSRNIPIP